MGKLHLDIINVNDKGNGKEKHQRKNKLTISVYTNNLQSHRHRSLSPKKMFGSTLTTPRTVSPPPRRNRYSPIKTSPSKKRIYCSRTKYKNKNCTSKMSTFILKKVLMNQDNTSLDQWYKEHIEWCAVCIRLKDIHRRRTKKNAGDEVNEWITVDDSGNEDLDEAAPFLDFLKCVGCKGIKS